MLARYIGTHSFARRYFGLLYSSLQLSSKLGSILFAPNFEETLIVTIKQGGTAETVIDSVNETIDSMTNRTAVIFSLQTSCLGEK